MGNEKRVWVHAWVLASMLAVGGCDEGEDLDDVAAQEDEDEHEDEDELRSGCWFISQPAGDELASVVGGNDYVYSDGSSNGGCDLHSVRVTADPAAGDRIMSVHFFATSFFEPPADYDAVVWKSSCTAAPCRAASATIVPLTVSGGGQVCTSGVCFPLPWYLEGYHELPAGNSVHTLTAGMRAFDADDQSYGVEITISE